jgi:hypothetical protein
MGDTNRQAEIHRLIRRRLIRERGAALLPVLEEASKRDGIQYEFVPNTGEDHEIEQLGSSKTKFENQGKIETQFDVSLIDGIRQVVQKALVLENTNWDVVLYDAIGIVAFSGNLRQAFLMDIKQFDDELIDIYREGRYFATLSFVDEDDGEYCDVSFPVE